MSEFNVIVYMPRDGYEVKTWLEVSNYNETSEDILSKMATEKIKSLGIKINKDDYFEFEQL